MSCKLCEKEGGTLLWRDDFCRVVRPAVDGYPGFLRVIVNRHVKEMTDLEERARLMRVVFACESALLQLYKPDKVNLASLGNVVPHVHWHVIARFAEDVRKRGGDVVIVALTPGQSTTAIVEKLRGK